MGDHERLVRRHDRQAERPAAHVGGEAEVLVEAGVEAVLVRHADERAAGRPAEPGGEPAERPPSEPERHVDGRRWPVGRRHDGTRRPSTFTRTALRGPVVGGRSPSTGLRLASRAAGVERTRTTSGGAAPSPASRHRGERALPVRPPVEHLGERRLPDASHRRVEEGVQRVGPQAGMKHGIARIDVASAQSQKRASSRVYSAVPT